MTIHHLRELVVKHRPHVVFLMDTKNGRGKLESIRRKMKMQNREYIEPVGLIGGIALWWNDEIEVKTIYKKRGFMDTIMVGRRVGKEFKATWVYAGCTFEKR